ncbi:MAG: DotU family type IV/VI secretion system protein [Planctomycetota bacterium]
MPKDSTLPLSDLASSFLHFLTTFVASSESIAMSEGWVREQIQDHLAKFESDARAGGYADLIEPATRLLVYTADDIIAHSPWGAKTTWQHLQAERFVGRVRGGEAFFEMFDTPAMIEDETVRQLAPLCQRSEIKELGFLCLSVGFLGRMRPLEFDEPDMVQTKSIDLATIRQRLIAGAPASRSESHLVDGAYDQTDDSEIPDLPVVRVARLAAILLGVAVLSIGGVYILEPKKVNEAIKIAKQIADRHANIQGKDK